MADLSGDLPRVIALIDALDLQWQVKRVGGAFGHDLTAVLEQLEAGVAKLNPALEERLPFALVHVYAPLEAEWPQEAERSGEFERVVFKPQAGGINRACWSCAKACTHCQEGTKGSGGQGHDNPIHGDLLESRPRRRIRLGRHRHRRSAADPGDPVSSVTRPEDHPRLLPSSRDGPHRGMLGVH